MTLSVLKSTSVNAYEYESMGYVYLCMSYMYLCMGYEYESIFGLDKLVNVPTRIL